MWIYDNNGSYIGFTYNGVEYYYVYNLQGDVVAITDSTGTIVAKYEYDTWGEVETTWSAAGTGNIAQINPIRYRGYYYDSERGLYYLNSRYYDPFMCRFLNADGYVTTGQGLTSFNMFAYCGNNPVMYLDYSGACRIAWSYGIQGPCPGAGKPGCMDNKYIKIENNKQNQETYTANGLRICTDGAKKGVIPDSNWQSTTAYGNYNKEIYLDALSVNYIVKPGDYNGKAKLGDIGKLTDLKTGNTVWCIVGEVGPTGTNFGEVSIAAVWDVGYSDHMSANYGISGDFEITIYPGSNEGWDWSKPLQPQINALGEKYECEIVSYFLPF